MSSDDLIDYAALDDRQKILLLRLARLLLLEPDAMLPALRARATFWAYTDCCDAGLRDVATQMLTMALGPADQRPALVRQFPRPPIPGPNPNTCVHCGHAGTAHSSGGHGDPPICHECATPAAKIHQFVGGAWETHVLKGVVLIKPSLLQQAAAPPVDQAYE